MSAATTATASTTSGTAPTSLLQANTPEAMREDEGGDPTQASERKTLRRVDAILARAITCPAGAAHALSRVRRGRHTEAAGEAGALTVGPGRSSWGGTFVQELWQR